MTYKTPFTPRRPYIDEEPDGYLESDNCFIKNNQELVMEFLNEKENNYEAEKTKCRKGV